MKYYNFQDLVKKSPLAKNTIKKRMYYKDRASNFGVIWKDGEKVVSEENFKKFWLRTRQGVRGIKHCNFCGSNERVEKFEDIYICKKCKAKIQ